MDAELQSQIDEATKLLGERKYEEVVSIVQSLLLRDTGGQAQRVFGMAQLGLGKYQEAVHVLMTAAQLLPNDATVAFAYGTAMNLNGQAEGGRASFERALGIDPSHPGARMGYLNTSKALADRDEPADPMKAIEWLYGVWQLDPTNLEMANRILDIYIKNGWGESARQFADLLPGRLKNSEAVVQKLKALPADAPPVNPANVKPSSAQPSVVQTLEACPFCKQQVMAGLFTCPHCKMNIRAQRDMPGGNYKPGWQEVSLNIFAWIGIIFGGFLAIMVFVSKTQATTGGSFTLAISAAYVIANWLIIARNDVWMSVSKILYIIIAMRSVFCGCTTYGQIGMVYGQSRQEAIFAFVIMILTGIYAAFMAYLLHFEGET